MRIVHLIYAGLGGHTSVFFAQEKFAEEYGIELAVCLYGVEDPLPSTISALVQKKIPYTFVKKRKGVDLGFTNKISSAIFKFDPDIVFLHSAQALPGLKLSAFLKFQHRKIKFIVRETQALNLKTTRQKAFSALSLLLSDSVVFLSEDYRSKFFSGSVWKKKFFKKTSVILNGLDVDYFKPRTVRKHDSQNLYRVGMISRLVSIKDHYTLIDSVVELRSLGYNIELHVAGDGVTFNDIQKYVATKGATDFVIMHGLISGSRIVSFLQSLDIYVHSSLGETMSNSIMQAQSCGLPIIATDVFGINNIIIDEENGYLFPLGDAGALVMIITRMLNDSGLIHTYGSISRAYAIEHLSDGKMFYEYYQLFSK